MSRAKIIAGLLLVAPVAGVAGWLLLHTPNDFQQVDVAAFESDATEAVVRELMQPAGTNGTAVYFLAFGHRLTPPTDKFISRFSGHLPPVKSCAASNVTPAGGIVDSAGGQAGVLIQIATIERKSNGDWEVEAARSDLPPGGNRFIFTVAQREGRWAVKNRKPFG